MVVKNRTSLQSDRFALPLVNELMETKEQKPLVMTQTLPLHASTRFDDTEKSPQSSFWRRWSSQSIQNEPCLPSWASNPQSGDMTSMVIPTLNSKAALVFTAKRRKTDMWSLLMLASVVIGLMTYWHLTVSLEAILGETEAMLSVRNSINIKLRSAEKDVRMLSREVQASEAMIKRRKDEYAQIFAQEESTALFQRNAVEAELNAIQQSILINNELSATLRSSVQSASARAVSNKWASNSRRVEIELEFPHGSGDGPTNFIAEMASLDLMPHSVHTFLEMVDKGLWNGCSFVMNAMHVIKAAPLPYDSSPAAAKARAFTDTGLNGPRFKESSDQYPHLKYTLGFAGGHSPSWYINTEDNTEIHGGDPAFARIIYGFDTIARLENSDTTNGIWFKQRIGIKSARIVSF